MGPQGPKKKIPNQLNKVTFLWHKSNKSMLFNKGNTKLQQSDPQLLDFSSERDITLQTQLGVWSPCTQALYFWPPVLLEKCRKAQIPCICPLSC